MLYEVKYGISIQMTQVIVNPLGCVNYDFAMGQLWIGYYNGTAFHAQLTDTHTGNRTFIVTGMSVGTYVVTQTGYAPAKVDVSADGVLTFVAEVGAGHVVDAIIA